MLLIKYNDSVVGVTPAGKASPTIEIPDGITSISENAFSYCTVLSEVIILDSVPNIGGRSIYRL